MFYFVQRDKTSGVIQGLYTARQPQPDGSDLTDPTPLPDTHPDVVTFLNHPPPINPLKALIDKASLDVNVPVSLKNILAVWKTQL